MGLLRSILQKLVLPSAKKERSRVRATRKGIGDLSCRAKGAMIASLGAPEVLKRELPKIGVGVVARSPSDRWKRFDLSAASLQALITVPECAGVQMAPDCTARSDASFQLKGDALAPESRSVALAPANAKTSRGYYRDPRESHVLHPLVGAKPLSFGNVSDWQSRSETPSIEEQTQGALWAPKRIPHLLNRLTAYREDLLASEKLLVEADSNVESTRRAAVDAQTRFERGEMQSSLRQHVESGASQRFSTQFYEAAKMLWPKIAFLEKDSRRVLDGHGFQVQYLVKYLNILAAGLETGKGINALRDAIPRGGRKGEFKLLQGPNKEGFRIYEFYVKISSGKGKDGRCYIWYTKATKHDHVTVFVSHKKGQDSNDIDLAKRHAPKHRRG